MTLEADVERTLARLVRNNVTTYGGGSAFEIALVAGILSTIRNLKVCLGL